MTSIGDVVFLVMRSETDGCTYTSTSVVRVCRTLDAAQKIAEKEANALTEAERDSIEFYVDSWTVTA